MKQYELTFMNSEENSTKYSAEDLDIFKLLITGKLDRAITHLVELKEILTGTGENDTRDTSWQFKADDGSQNNTKDETTIIAHKQEVFIESLRNALIRIDKGNYGICLQTGVKIDKNRLMAVPNTTICLVVKKQLQDTKVIINEINNLTKE